MLSIRSTADVTKVRRFSSVVVDHVESCHDKTRAVPHNSYITVKLDKRQTVLTSLSLQRSHLATSLFRAFKDNTAEQFFLDVQLLLYQDLLHLLPLDRHAEDLARPVTRLLRLAAKLDTTSLSSARDQDLGLDDNLSTNPLVNISSFVRCRSQPSSRSVDSQVLSEGLGLVLE